MARAAGLRAAAGRALPAQRWGEGGGGICTVVICSDRVEHDILLRPLEDVRQVCLVERVDHVGDVVVADRGDAHSVVRHIVSRDAFGVHAQGTPASEDMEVERIGGAGVGVGHPQPQAPVNSTCNKRAPPRGGARGRGGSV